MELANFFSAAEGRLDRWRTLHRIAKTLVGVAEKDAQKLRQEAQTLLADMGPSRISVAIQGQGSWPRCTSGCRPEIGPASPAWCSGSAAD